MSLNKVACPHCQAVLKSAKPLSAGLEVKCPKCAAAFKVPTEALVAAGSSLPASGQAAQSQAPTQPSASMTPTLHGSGESTAEIPPPVADAACVGPQRTKRLAIVAGASVAVLALAGILLAVTLSGGPSETKDKPPLDPDPGTPPAKQEVALKPLIELSAEDEDKVKNMIARGMDYLKKTQNANGSWGKSEVQMDNYVAFAGLTLLSCGAPASDPAVQKAAQFARERMPHVRRTYVASLFLLFFDKLIESSQKANVHVADIPKDREHMRALALRLVAGQLHSGGWGYGVPVLADADAQRFHHFLADAVRSSKEAKRKGTDEEVRKSSEEVRRQITEEGRSRLSKVFRNTGVLNAPAADAFASAFRGGDNSNTQFATLALWAARRNDLPVENALDLAARRFRNTQRPDGGFPYSTTAGSPSMTCAGLLGLAVGFGMEEKIKAGQGPQQDDAVKKALQQLSQSIGKKGPKSKNFMVDMYFLWSVERVAVLYQLKEIEGKEWFQWGMAMLSENQEADGSWHSRRGTDSDHLVDTCFALLFLNRVNLAADLTEKLRRGSH